VTDILEAFARKAEEATASCDPEAFILRGLWRTDYVLRVNENASVFHLHYVIAQTLEQGCCYYEPESEEVHLGEGLLGRSVFEFASEQRSLRIAALDAVFASTYLGDAPDKVYHLDGRNIEKADRRAEIVCKEVLSILESKSPKHVGARKVVNVGVVGNILSVLGRQETVESRATDLYPGVIGSRVHGVTVENGSGSFYGSRTLELVRESDVAIVTGMTLETNTLDEIVAAALDSGTGLVVFAETGSHFGREYCKMGVDAVIGEPFPFYLSCGGTSRINIYRRGEHHYR
jgi:hypothetical protein